MARRPSAAGSCFRRATHDDLLLAANDTGRRRSPVGAARRPGRWRARACRAALRARRRGPPTPCSPGLSGPSSVSKATEETRRFTRCASRSTSRWDYINAPSGIVEVATGSGGGDCGYRFAIGKRYLVYARKWPPSGSGLTTGICSRTRQIEEADEDIKYPELNPREGHRRPRCTGG